MIGWGEIDGALRAANPADRCMLARLDLQQAKREHLAGVAEEALEQGGPVCAPPGARPRRRRLDEPVRGPRLALAAASCAVAVVLVALGFGLGSAGSPAPALGAAVERLAKVSPHVLLDAPGWRAEAAFRIDGDAGVIRFRSSGPARLAAVLEWQMAPPGTSPARPMADAVLLGTGPAIGRTARIYARPIPPSSRREYLAAWTQFGRLLQLSSVAASRGAFDHRLAALRVVDRGAWLAAVPKHLVQRGKWVTPTVFSCRPLVPDGNSNTCAPRAR